MKAELIPADGGPPIPITRDVTLVGRREYCDLQIDDPSLSKRHCMLVKTEGLLIIRDLITTNGTKVKGQKIRWAALLPEDRVSFGSIKFKVYLGPDEAPTPSEQAARAGSPPSNFAAPTPVPLAPAPVQAKVPISAPKPSSRPDSDMAFPLVGLDEAAWRDALGSLEGFEDEPEVEGIDLD